MHKHGEGLLGSDYYKSTMGWLATLVAMGAGSVVLLGTSVAAPVVAPVLAAAGAVLILMSIVPSAMEWTQDTSYISFNQYYQAVVNKDAELHPPTATTQ